MSMQITFDTATISDDERRALLTLIGFDVAVTADTKKYKYEEMFVENKDNQISPEDAFGGLSNAQLKQVADNIPMKVGDKITGIQDDPLTIISVTGSVPLDKAGLPWDARIHSSNKAAVADGTWRKKRGVDPALVVTVEAELHQVMGAPRYSTTQKPLKANHISIQEKGDTPETTFVPSPPPTPASEMPPIPDNLKRAPTPPPPPPAAGFEDRNPYIALVGRTSRGLADKRITQEQVTNCCAKFGVTALPLLANRLDLVPHIAAEIDALLEAVK